MPRNNHLIKFLARRYGGDEIKTQIEKFATDLDVSYGAVNKWVWGVRRPRYDMQKRIAKLTKGRMSFEHW